MLNSEQNAQVQRTQRWDEEKTNARAHTSPMQQLIFLLHSGHLCAWLVTAGVQPKTLPIKGETRLTVRDASSLDSAYEDIATRLQDDAIPIEDALWVADAQGRQWCATLKLADWQLPWEWLGQRLGLGLTAPWNSEQALENVVLPWLVTADDTAQRAYLKEMRENEHSLESERLAVERAKLVQENEHLRAENTALQKVDAEQLVCFLPALYPRVFTAIGPSDLALLCGRVEPLALPNPYPEPVEETLRVLQKRFRALPQSLQKQIASFMAQLPHGQKLRPRPEMRALLEDLTGL